jgi:hypothetical protein
VDGPRIQVAGRETIAVRHLTKRFGTLPLAALILNTSVSLVRKRLLFWDPGSRQAGAERIKSASGREAV